jgi:hypothetical protein
MRAKCTCGRAATHTYFQAGEHHFLCCKCYIAGGNPPADWHVECMQEFNLRTAPTKVQVEAPQ